MSNSSNTTKLIARMAIFVAIGVVLNIFSSTFFKLEFFGRISLVYAYCYLCGYFFGGILGFAVACIADFLPAVILPEGGQIWMPLITLSNGVMAFISGIVFKKLKFNKFLKLLLISGISFIFSTLILTALGETILYLYFGGSAYYKSITVLVESLNISVYLAFVIRKIIIQPFWIALNILLTFFIIKNKFINNLLSDYKTETTQ